MTLSSLTSHRGYLDPGIAEEPTIGEENGKMRAIPKSLGAEGMRTRWGG